MPGLVTSSTAPLGEIQKSHRSYLMEHIYGKNLAHLQVILLIPDLLFFVFLALSKPTHKPH